MSFKTINFFVICFVSSPAALRKNDHNCDDPWVSACWVPLWLVLSCFAVIDAFLASGWGSCAEDVRGKWMCHLARPANPGAFGFPVGTSVPPYVARRTSDVHILHVNLPLGPASLRPWDGRVQGRVNGILEECAFRTPRSRRTFRVWWTGELAFASVSYHTQQQYKTKNNMLCSVLFIQ